MLGYDGAATIWIPSGIALAALLLFGRAFWPAVLAGALLVNVTSSGTLPTAIPIAIGNTLEAVLGAWLVERYARGRHAFQTARDIFSFALLAPGAASAIGALIGAGTLLVSGVATQSSFLDLWVTWWLGNAGAQLVVTPLILLWSTNRRRPRWNPRRVLEATALVVLTIAVGRLTFMGTRTDYPLQFLVMPICVWTAFRFRLRGAPVIVALLYVIAVWGTALGLGPFARPSRNESMILLQAFTSVVAVTTLTLAAVVVESRRNAAELRQQASTDSLTGLANYRSLIGVIEHEIRRSERTARQFAVAFLDVNGLKKINDRLGHLTGSRALVRVSLALKRSCRAIDTASRYGGDEFVLVLPESDVAAAQLVARRLTDLLAADTEEPPVTVSYGIAVHPTDGVTTAELLAKADAAQYAAKGALARTT